LGACSDEPVAASRITALCHFDEKIVSMYAGGMNVR
jgi:hypothetical protein